MVGYVKERGFQFPKASTKIRSPCYYSWLVPSSGPWLKVQTLLDKLNNTSANKNSVHTWRQGISLEFRCVFGQKGHKANNKVFSTRRRLPDWLTLTESQAGANVALKFYQMDDTLLNPKSTQMSFFLCIWKHLPATQDSFFSWRTLVVDHMQTFHYLNKKPTPTHQPPLTLGPTPLGGCCPWYPADMFWVSHEKSAFCWVMPS